MASLLQSFDIVKYGKETFVDIWFKFGILEILVKFGNFICVFCISYVDLMESVNLIELVVSASNKKTVLAEFPSKSTFLTHTNAVAK
jgi:hypothetical protein